MKKTLTFFILTACFVSGYAQKKVQQKADFIIASGQMPALTTDKQHTLHLVYGTGDSIMYSFSADNGNSFANPVLISVLPGAFTFAMRGPQIAATDAGLIVTAPTQSGNIFSFYKTQNGKWAAGGRINDADTTAKEGLMAFSADHAAGFAVWLDLRGNKRNKIYGAGTKDGGKTWLKNTLVYASPDSSVCECCKPSVIIAGKKVFVMFRNWLNGSRDLYLAESTDGGLSFNAAQKLGEGTWKLNGCPMDGGAIALNNGTPETVWRRQGKIFTSAPGEAEKEIGEGRNCTIEVADGKNIYSWTENGLVVVIDKKGQKRMLGKGTQPVLKALRNNGVICIWENKNKIHASIF